MPRILIVDDDEPFRLAMRTAFSRRGYDVLLAGNADEVEAALLGKRAPPPVHEVPSLDRQEWEYLNRILADCNGNISEAARRLKMHRRTLQRKLQKHPPKV